jgi:hypothetical protein
MRIAIVCNIGPECAPTSFRDMSGKFFSFRAICAKTAQKKVSKALPAMESSCRTIREGSKPAFSGGSRDLQFAIVAIIQKTFSCQFSINTALCASSGNLRAWEDL